MTASEKLRALLDEWRTEQKCPVAVHDVFPLIADVVEAAEDICDVPVPDSRLQEPLTALRDALEER